jgi:hypothetical protein
LWSKKLTWWRDEPEPSIINDKTIADFTRVVELEMKEAAN